MSTPCGHHVRSAWIVEKERLQSVWDPSDVTSDEIWACVGRDIEQGRLSIADMVFLMGPESDDDRRLWLKAWIFYAEWHVHLAIRSASVAKHMVASSEFVMTQYHNYLLLDHPVQPQCMAPLIEARNPMRFRAEAQRQWLCRYRQRWGCIYQKLPNRKVMLDDKLRSKVGPKRMPDSVPRNETKNGHISGNVARNGPKMLRNGAETCPCAGFWFHFA